MFIQRTAQERDIIRNGWYVLKSFCGWAETPLRQMNFAECRLKKQMLEILEQNGFHTPTDIQKAVIPVASQHKSVIAISNTGSGKTLAFLIPIINDIIKSNQFYHSIILTPTREIATQIDSVCNILGKDIGLRTLTIIGGEDERDQKSSIFKSPHIIIGTPGRLHYILKKINLFKNLKFLVLDEADKLFEGIYTEDLTHICANTPETKALLLFSATMTHSMQSLANLQMKGCEIFKIGVVERAPDRIAQKYVLIPEKHKLSALLWICENIPAKKIIFAKSCLGVQTLRIFLSNLNVDALSLHGGMKQEERNAALDSFRQKDACVLVATDIAARGIDIPEVEMIMNYDLPANSKEYLHRIGRTARGSKNGTAVSLVTQYDIAIFQRIEQDVGVKMDLFETNIEHIKSCEHKSFVAYKSAYDEVKNASQGEQSFKKRRRVRVRKRA